MGYLPDWYVILRAARYMGVAPWEVEQMPVYYRDQALAAESAEAKAEEQLSKRKKIPRGSPKR